VQLQVGLPWFSAFIMAIRTIIGPPSITDHQQKLGGRLRMRQALLLFRQRGNEIAGIPPMMIYSKIWYCRI
jgi:hypothetical protein